MKDMQLIILGCAAYSAIAIGYFTALYSEGNSERLVSRAIFWPIDSAISFMCFWLKNFKKSKQ